MNKLLVAAAAGLAFVLSAPADAAVRYDFKALSSYDHGPFFGVTTGGFVYDAPSFITTDTIVPASALVSCSVTSTAGPVACWQQEFAFDAVLFGVLSPIGGGQINYFFPTGAFGAVGTYKTIYFHGFQDGTLVVSKVTAGPGVPEPATWATLILGFGAVGSLVRRRRRLAV